MCHAIKITKLMYDKKVNTVRIYLDQNVIDYLIKGNLSFIDDILHKSDSSVVIYSYVTLREFARIKEDSQREHYLNYLKELEAEYFWVDNNEIAHFRYVDPFLQFNESISENKIYNEIESSMYKMMHKLLGGKKDWSLDELAQSQKKSFNHLMEYLINFIDSSDELPDANKEVFKKDICSMNLNLDNLIDDFTNKVKINYPNNEDPLEQLRKLCDINVDKLNKIGPPNIIDKIWSILKDGIKTSKINISYDDLFGERLEHYFSNQKVTMSMRINGLYNLLNSIGYHTDKNFRNEKRFMPFINDHHHVGNAIYSNLLITRDRKMMKKAEAVYEHYKIGTQIIFVDEC